MLTPFSGEITDIFFFALRLMAAAGGFLAGWFATGPLATLLARLAFHRSMPEWTVYWAKLAGGLLVGLLVFWYLPLGLGGGGGGGSGGGTGKGVGPHADGPGTGKTATGKGDDTGKGGPRATDTGKGKDILEIEVLGGTAVKDGKYYLINRKAPAVDKTAMEAYLDANRARLAGMDIILPRTDQSVDEDHRAVRQLQQMAKDRNLRSLVVPDREKQ
jgi:hypothetical protein